MKTEKQKKKIRRKRLSSTLKNNMYGGGFAGSMFWSC